MSIILKDTSNTTLLCLSSWDSNKILSIITVYRYPAKEYNAFMKKTGEIIHGKY